MAGFSFARFGNDLYTGRRSVDFVGRWRTWLLIGVGLVVAAVLVLLIKGLNPGIEFRGGSEFRISNVQTLDQSLAGGIVGEVLPEAGSSPGSRSSARARSGSRPSGSPRRRPTSCGARWPRATGSSRPTSPRRSSGPRGAPTSRARP